MNKKSSTETDKSKKEKSLHFLTGTVTGVVIIAFLLILLTCKPLPFLVDKGSVKDSGVRTVSQLNATTYCPARMALADTTAFGEVKPSEGNIASATKYAAFGPVYNSTVLSLSGVEHERLVDHDLEDREKLQTASASADQGANLQRTQLLQATQGAGAASSVLSWATEGDLSGVQASSCLNSDFEHVFLLPSTQQGWSQQLVVYNPSTKATSVNIKAYGTKTSGELPLTTRGSLVVKATGEATFDVTAAAPDQDGLLLSVSGTDVPVSVMVRATAMSGTEPKGADFVLDAGDASKQVSLPGLEEHDQTQLLLSGEVASSVRVAWATKDGRKEAKKIELEGQRVVNVDLGEAPENVVGLFVESSNAVNAAAVVTRSGEHGQKDFAVVNAAPSAEVSALAVPDHSLGRLLLMNPGKAGAKVYLYGFDGDGRHVSNKQENLAPGQSVEFDLSTIGDKVAIVRLEDASKQVVWNVRVGVPAVAEAKLAGLAVLRPTSLMPQSQTIRTHQNQGIVK